MTPVNLHSIYDKLVIVSLRNYPISVIIKLSYTQSNLACVKFPK